MKNIKVKDEKTGVIQSVPEGLMFTNHFDREKNPIFEGDIIEFTQLDVRTNVETKFVAEVYYDYSNSALRIRTKDGLKGFFPVNNAKIIGTIVLNPEKFI